MSRKNSIKLIYFDIPGSLLSKKNDQKLIISDTKCLFRQFFYSYSLGKTTHPFESVKKHRGKNKL